MSPSVSVRLLLTQSDERLVGYARAGHERAFEALVQRYRRQLHAYCRRLLLSNERAEDAVQQALLQAWVALRGGTEVHDVRPWLYRIVHNAAVNALRVSGYDYCTLSESLSGADAPQADLDRRIAVREALAGLAALPEMQREALLRTALEGRSHQQVASDLGVSEPALRGLVYRARTALRAAAGAIVPPPLLGWALEAGTRGAPALEGVASLGAGGGSAGLAGLLVKGSVVAVTAGALASGIVASHAHKAHAHSPIHALRPHGVARTRALGTVGATQAVAFTRPVGHGVGSDTARHSSRLPDFALGRTGRAFRTRGRHASMPQPDALRHSDGSAQGGSRHGMHDGGSGDSSSHDGHGGALSGSGSGSGDQEHHDGGGGTSRDGGSSGFGNDGSGDPNGRTSSSGEPTASVGGTSSGPGDLQPRESAPGGDSSSTTNGSKDGKEEPVEGSSKGG